MAGNGATEPGSAGREGYGAELAAAAPLHPLRPTLLPEQTVERASPGRPAPMPTTMARTNPAQPAISKRNTPTTTPAETPVDTEGALHVWPAPRRVSPAGTIFLGKDLLHWGRLRRGRHLESSLMAFRPSLAPDSEEKSAPLKPGIKQSPVSSWQRNAGISDPFGKGRGPAIRAAPDHRKI